MADYRVALLHRLGFPVTKENLRFLAAWQAQEGGATHNNATFNWFNTTRGDQYPSINSVGVRAFPDFQTGIEQTAATFNNGRYNDILAGLKAGNPYKAAVQDDLSTWVSGSPTKGLRYAQRVLGGRGVPETSSPRALAKKVKSGAAPVNTGTDQDTKRQALLSFLIASNNALISGDEQPDIAALLPVLQATQQTPQKATERVLSGTKAAHGFLQAPTAWKGTHVTDGLGWGTKTAEDIMAPAGTQVGAPEDGVIEYFHPNGAQGGGSMILRTPSGKKYWLGHIANGLPGGTRVRKGQVIAVISSDHPRPHLHIDER